MTELSKPAESGQLEPTKYDGRLTGKSPGLGFTGIKTTSYSVSYGISF